MNRTAFLCLASAISLFVASCGGGGGGGGMAPPLIVGVPVSSDGGTTQPPSTEPPPTSGGGTTTPPNTSTDVLVAKIDAPRNTLASRKIVLNGTYSTINGVTNSNMTWDWSITSAPNGSIATLENSKNSSTPFTPDVVGNYVVRLVVGWKNSVSQATEFTLEVLTVPTIGIDSPEPLTGTVVLTVSPGYVYDAKYSLIGRGELGYGNTDEKRSFTWNTERLENGSYTVQATMNTPWGSVDTRRTVAVWNSPVTMSTRVYPIDRGVLSIIVHAISKFGTPTVSMNFDGVPSGLLTEPNFCLRMCGSGGGPQYRFDFDATLLAPGLHKAVIIGTDPSGNTRKLEVEVTI